MVGDYTRIGQHPTVGLFLHDFAKIAHGPPEACGFEHGPTIGVSAAGQRMNGGAATRGLLAS